ncbi:hypothetical protein L596_013571 [Steinernema carpocapsae]|uniref:Uncharacterized protein n=1 Tax=Steinernema carpocapsae TaxID=34508 RepID=A0A4U5P1F2_STECR|nr:hypothetical protein L596_013571 [Steinernema carpocapsae]
MRYQPLDRSPQRFDLDFDWAVFCVHEMKIVVDPPPNQYRIQLFKFSVRVHACLITVVPLATCFTMKESSVKIFRSFTSSTVFLNQVTFPPHLENFYHFGYSYHVPILYSPFTLQN